MNNTTYFKLFISLLTFVGVLSVNVFAQQVKVTENIRYADTPSSEYRDRQSDRLLDIYIPETPVVTPIPVVIFVHGGGFATNDKEGTKEICTQIAKQGFAVVSINYRLYLKGKNIHAARADVNMGEGLPADGKFHPELQKALEIASEDVVLALGWLKKNTHKYQLDKRSVALAGGSAGGMAVLHAAYLSGQKKLPVKAVINLWGGVADTSLMKAQKKLPPLLTFQGDQDKIIHVDYAHALRERMEELGSSNSITYIEKGKGHALYAFIARNKIAEVVAFLNKTLK